MDGNSRLLANRRHDGMSIAYLLGESNSEFIFLECLLPMQACAYVQLTSWVPCTCCLYCILSCLLALSGLWILLVSFDFSVYDQCQTDYGYGLHLIDNILFNLTL